MNIYNTDVIKNRLSITMKGLFESGMSDIMELFEDEERKAGDDYLNIIIEHVNSVERELAKAMMDIYLEGYNYNMSLAAKLFGTAKIFMHPGKGTEDKIQKILGNAYLSLLQKSESDIYNSSIYLISQLTGLKISKDRFNTELKNTFMKHISIAMNTFDSNQELLLNAAAMDCMKAYGASKYFIVAILDQKTTDKCMEMNGKIFYIQDAREGVNLPPFHYNCRSLVLPYQSGFYMNIMNEMNDFYSGINFPKNYDSAKILKDAKADIKEMLKNMSDQELKNFLDNLLLMQQNKTYYDSGNVLFQFSTVLELACEEISRRLNAAGIDAKKYPVFIQSFLLKDLDFSKLSKAQREIFWDGIELMDRKFWFKDKALYDLAFKMLIAESEENGGMLDLISLGDSSLGGKPVKRQVIAYAVLGIPHSDNIADIADYIRGIAGQYNYKYDYEWFNMDTGFLKMLSEFEITNTAFDDILDNGLAEMIQGLSSLAIISQHLNFYNEKYNSNNSKYDNDAIEREGTSRTQTVEGTAGNGKVPSGIGGGVTVGGSGVGEGSAKTTITPEIESKILNGQRIEGSNKVIGGHSPNIDNANPNYAVQEIRVNLDGSKVVKYYTQFHDGNLSKLKTSTLFPDSWSDSNIINSIKTVGDAPAIGIRDNLTLHRATINGVEIDVIKDGINVISGYPTGGMPTPGFSSIP